MFRVLASRIIAQNVKIMNIGKYIPSLKMTICQNRQNWPKIPKNGKISCYTPLKKSKPKKMRFSTEFIEENLKK